MVKNEKFQCPSERGGPEDFKNHPTFVPSAILGGVMASQTWGHFFWDTLYCGVCLNCGKVNITSGYDEKIWFSAYNRFKSHKASIKSKKYLMRLQDNLHPQKVKGYIDRRNFIIKVERNYRKCLDRQLYKSKKASTSSPGNVTRLTVGRVKP